MDYEPVTTRYRGDCPSCFSHIVMKIRRPLTRELETRKVESPWTCIICGAAVKLEYPEGIVRG
jgi:DNA-directed RNA polymerase subunit RPC12/RpoP